MSVELQNIDCNCNCCKHMVRDIEKFKVSLEKHHKWQYDYFTLMKNKLVAKAKEHLKNGDEDKHDNIMKEANRMNFIFNKSTAAIQFGNCLKFDNKPVSFIPNTCQLDTQDCFENRKQIL